MVCDIYCILAGWILKQILFRVTDEQHAELTEMAASNGVSVQKYIQRRLYGNVPKRSRNQLLMPEVKSKELRLRLSDSLHGHLKTSAAYHHWTMQEEARAILADALTGALVTYPKEIKTIRQFKMAVDKIGRNVLSGVRTGMISEKDTYALSAVLNLNTELLRALMSTIENGSRWNRVD